MPQFNPGEEGVAIATFPTKPAGLPCTAEMWLASDMTKVATSGEIPFTATGEDQAISLPITLPGVEGTYPVYLYVFSNGERIAVFRSDEDVVITAPAPDLILGDALIVHSINGHKFSEVGQSYATLKEPITMSRLEGVDIQFTYTGAVYNTMSYTGLYFYLRHQIPGDPAAPGTPVYRGFYKAPLGGMIHPGWYAWAPSPWGGSGNIKWLSSGGYYKNIAYDLRIQVGVQFYDQSFAGPSLGTFTIKNAIICTGTGVVQ